MDQQQPHASTDYVPLPPQVAQVPSRNKRKVLALWLLIGPTALIVGSIILYAIVNFIVTSTAPAPADGEIFSPPSPVHSIVDILLFLAGGISVLTWLPGIIIGVILLTTKKET